ncbi:hypothetical protein V3N99_11760 [Dermatophilaceae bacterium Soc4.6]
MTDSTDTPDSPDSTGNHRAGAFDIRNIIAGLLGIYGVVLVAMGLFGDPETAKTGGVNANLYAGVAMVVVSVAFATWARVRPVVVPATAEGA